MGKYHGYTRISNRRIIQRVRVLYFFEQLDGDEFLFKIFRRTYILSYCVQGVTDFNGEAFSAHAMGPKKKKMLKKSKSFKT